MGVSVNFGVKGSRCLKTSARRSLVCAGFAAALAACPAFADGGYSIEINGEDYEIGLDTPQELVLPDGTRLNVVLSQDEFAVYTTDAFSFSHKNEYKPSRVDVGAGVLQTTLVTPLGSGILVQEYPAFDPSSLIDLMVSELTKEEIGYGYEFQENDVSKRVGDKLVEGKEAITSYQETRWTRSVYAYGRRDSGILIMTFIQDAYIDQDKATIDDFWRTLEIN